MEEIGRGRGRQGQSNQKLSCGGVGKENEMMLGSLVSPKSSFDFIQNCDLPPPLKVFTGMDKAVAFSMDRVFMGMGMGMDMDMVMGRDKANDDHDHDHGDEAEADNKLEVLKALRLSQTRAREAEKKAAGLAEERELISKAFMKDSLHLFAYRQWVRLLEIQVSKLQSQQDNHFRRSACCDKAEDEEMSWFVALALCLGIATVGFAFGCKYLF